MRDYPVRVSFHKTVLTLEHTDENTIVIDELGLKNGGTRADIAVLNGKMVGYEIKTNKDNLARLEKQIVAYNEVFDEVHIITGNRHLNKVLEIVPSWWGVFLVIETESGEYFFNCVRTAKKNTKKVCLGIAQLLWKEEIMHLLTAVHNYTLKPSLNKQVLYQMLVGKFNANELGKITLKYLKSREGWRTNQKVPE